MATQGQDLNGEYTYGPTRGVPKLMQVALKKHTEVVALMDGHIMVTTTHRYTPKEVFDDVLFCRHDKRCNPIENDGQLVAA